MHRLLVGTLVPASVQYVNVDVLRKRSVRENGLTLNQERERSEERVGKRESERESGID